jgi:hypothetical protein
LRKYALRDIGEVLSVLHMSCTIGDLRHRFDADDAFAREIRLIAVIRLV